MKMQIFWLSKFFIFFIVQINFRPQSGESGLEKIAFQYFFSFSKQKKWSDYLFSMQKNIAQARLKDFSIHYLATCATLIPWIGSILLMLSPCRLLSVAAASQKASHVENTFLDDGSQPQILSTWVFYCCPLFLACLDFFVCLPTFLLLCQGPLRAPLGHLGFRKVTQGFVRLP